MSLPICKLASLHFSLAASHTTHTPFKACSVINIQFFTFTSVINMIGCIRVLQHKAPPPKNFCATTRERFLVKLWWKRILKSRANVFKVHAVEKRPLAVMPEPGFCFFIVFVNLNTPLDSVNLPTEHFLTEYFHCFYFFTTSELETKMTYLIPLATIICMCMFILSSCKSQKQPCVLTCSIVLELHLIPIFNTCLSLLL